MKSLHYYFLGLICFLLIASCAHSEKWNDIHTFKVEASANAPKKVVTTDIGDIISNTPYDITVDMEFMDTTSIENREACHKINTYLISKFLNQEEEIDGQKAVEIFIDQLQKQYAKDDMSREIFDHYTGKTIYGREGVINYVLIENYYGGGAHPTSITNIRSFDAVTGELISLHELFPDTCINKICDKLTMRLMEKLGVDDIDSLHSIGYLDMIDMFISENFLLDKDSISFFYNQYDIAPYSCGTTTLSFSYKELKEYLKQKEE